MSRSTYPTIDETEAGGRLTGGNVLQVARRCISAALALIVGAFLASAALIADSALAEEGSAVPAPRGGAEAWDLSSVLVVNAGRIRALPEGSFRDGIELAANAASNDPGLLPAATFRLQLTAFSPAADTKGQRKGTWYVRGTWSLAEPGVVPAAGRHVRGALSGQVIAELPADPTTSGTAWSARLHLPSSMFVAVDPQAGVRRVRGDGLLKLDNKSQGRISLNLNLSPKL